MKISRNTVGNIAIVIIVAFVIASVSAAFYRDWMFRRNIRDGIKASREAIENNEDRTLVNAVRKVDENFHIYFDHHIFLSNKTCRDICDYIKFLTNNPRIQDDTDFLHILVEPIDHLALTLNRITRGKVSEYRVVKMVTDYNFSWKAEKDEIDDAIIARALEADPEVLVLYDVACRHYHNRGKAEEVVALGMKSFKCEGADTHRADILYYMKQALSDYGTINWDAGHLISSTALGAGINLDTFIPSRYIPFVDAEQCPTNPEATPQEPYPSGNTPTNF